MRSEEDERWAPTSEGVQRVERRGDEDVEGDVGEVDESGEHDCPCRYEQGPFSVI